MQKPPTRFKVRGNRIQYELNTTIIDDVDLCSAHLETWELTNATEELSRLNALLVKRNGQIRFADKSPAGLMSMNRMNWPTILEMRRNYVTAEKRAISKIWKSGSPSRPLNRKRFKSQKRRRSAKRIIHGSNMDHFPATSPECLRMPFFQTINQPLSMKNLLYLSC